MRLCRTLGGRGRAAGDTEFAVDVLKVLGDRPWADSQCVGDRGVGSAQRYQLENSLLAISQGGQAGWGRRAQCRV
jgi:hypothetical protein